MTKRELRSSIVRAIEKNPLRKHIKKVSLFGSYANGKPKKDSDVDLLIEFSPAAKIGLFKLLDIQEHVEKFIGKKVDLLTPEAISPYFRKNVLSEAEVIYEG